MKARKRRMMLFFNSSDKVKARLSISGHVPKQSEMMYWIICGQHKGKWWGHRSSYYCPICNVQLCIRAYSGQKKSCWSLWYSCKVSKLSKTPRLVGSSPPENTSGANDEGVEKEALVEIKSTRAPWKPVEESMVPRRTSKRLLEKTAGQTSSHDCPSLTTAAYLGPTRRQRRE